ncbi:MAG: hypothetical protein AAFQ79_01345 [Pseudomonadota bacterium]
MMRAAWGRGALFVLALTFLGSGILRIADGTAMAIAREGAETGAAEDTADSPTPAAQPGLSEALAAIREREAAVTVREAQIEDRLAALDLAEAAIARQLAELEAAEARLMATMAQSERAAEDDLARLTSVYENMKPKDAVPLFQQMSPEFAAGFLGRMRPDAAAEIMAGLSPDTAYTISVLLAGRNALAPTE